MRNLINREELAARLRELANKEFTGQLSQGAMCYSTVRDVGTVDVLCSICCQKTVHPKGPLVKELEECNRLIQSVNIALDDLQLKLDTSEFCSHCQGVDYSSVAYGPGTTPSLYVHIKYSDEEQPSRKSISSTSLRDLLALLGAERW